MILEFVYSLPWVPFTECTDMAGVGAFTTAELLAWFKGVDPTVPKNPQRTNYLRVAPAGAVGYNLRLKAEAATAQREREMYEQEDEYEEPEPTQFPPNYYNSIPDDEEAFDYVDDYDPGNPINPKATPGDHDYGVDQSTDVYEEFSFEDDKNPRLPIHDYKREILSTISAGQVWCCRW